MKIKNIVTVLLVTIILASCAPAAKVVPTETAIPSITPIPSTPTIAPTLAPENLADAKGLSKWVDDYVHAYGGNVTVNDVEMNASQLTDEIRKNVEPFMQVKVINGIEFSFLVVNDMPLALSTSKEQWKKILGRNLAEAIKMDFAMPILYSDISDPQNAEILQNANKVVMTNDLAMNVAYGNLTIQDWKNVLANWESIKKSIDDGKIPDGIPYNWKQADVVFKFALDHNLKVRVQHLLDSGPKTPDSIHNGGFTKEELKQILEFTTSVTVLKYKGKVAEWDAEDEQVMADIHKQGNENYGFWAREVGLVDATEIVARAVKKLDPNAEIIIGEDHILDERFGSQLPNLRQQLFNFIDVLQKKGVPLDGICIENNEWIHNPPNIEYMKQILDEIRKKGLYVSAPESTVITTDTYPWYEPIQKTEDAAPETIHRDIVEAYILSGANGIGFGNVGDKWSFWNYSGIDAKDSLFDKGGQPKPAYYEVLKVLYKHIP